MLSLSSRTASRFSLAQAVQQTVCLALLALSLLPRVDALYFYLKAGEQKCFLEELPNHTIVVGQYKAEEWSPEDQTFVINEKLGIQITVEEVDSKERIVNTRGSPEGKFTFTSHDSGDHTICLRTSYDSGWFQTSEVKMHLDIAVGEAKVDEQGEKEHVHDLAEKMSDLNKRLNDIRKEQQYQREREAEFRDLSEATNSRAVWWSVIQLCVLFGACAWQLRHLKKFFDKKKLI